MPIQELTLKTRWVEHKNHEYTKKLYAGLRVEYYGNGMNNISEGVIKSKDGIFVIVWNTVNAETPIDGSDHSNKILSDCGFSII